MKHKIVLVNPPLTGGERYGRLASAGVYMPPLGLGFLSAELRARGFEVGILDCEALRLTTEQTISRVLRFNPDYVGITAVTLSIYSSAELAEGLKKNNDSLCVILGGAHITAVPEETMDLFPQFDVGVIGEGEVTTVELLRAIQQNKPLNNIKGIVYRDDGELIKTPQRHLIENLDILPPPAWDLFPDLKRCYRPSAFGFKRLPSMSLITARGCLGKCSFCSDILWRRQYREHSAEYVIKMIKELYHVYGFRDLVIYDGTFGVNRGRLVKLCEMLIKEKLGLAWSCNFRIEMAEPGILRLMKRAGCWSIAYGIESCSQKILDFLQKDISLETIAKGLRYTKESGIVCKGYIILGTLTESPETIRQTMSGVLKLDLDLLTVNHFTPFPGTLDYKRADKYGEFNRNWRLLSQHNLVFTPLTLTQHQIDHSIRTITRKFYMRPRIVWKYIKMCLNLYHFKALFYGLIAFLKFITPKPIKENGKVRI